MKKNKIIVCGSRTFNDYALMQRVLDSILASFEDPVEIISGHAEGADKLSERYAKEHDILCAVFPAQWEKYGKKAGPIRNSQMLDYAMSEDSADAMVVAFWDGNSRGTADTLRKAQQLKVKTVVCIYKDGNENPNIVEYVYKKIEDL